jgi:hypothetical protein
MDFARCRDVNNRAGTRWLSEIDDDASAARPGREQQAIGDTIGSVVDLLHGTGDGANANPSSLTRNVVIAAMAAIPWGKSRRSRRLLRAAGCWRVSALD